MIKKIFAVIIATALTAASVAVVDSPALGDGEALGTSFLFLLGTFLVLGAGWCSED